MTSELRPAVEVWRDAAYQYGGMSIEGGEGEGLAAAVIEADREAVRAELVREIVAWLRRDEDPYPDSYDIADEIEAKFGKANET